MKILFFIFLPIMLIQLNSVAFVDSKAFNSADSKALKFDLSNWPVDIQNNLVKTFPEISTEFFDEEQLNVLIKKIYAKIHFNKIKIIKLMNSYQIIAEPNNTIDEIIFVNTRFLNDEEIQEIVNLNLIDANDPAKVNTAIEKLVSYYKSLGYQKAQGRNEYLTTADFKRKLKVEMNVGPKTTIQSISFAGINPEDIQFLKNNIYWNYIGKNFTDERLKKINTELRTLLNRQNLYLVNILSPQIKYNFDDTQVKLVYQFSKKAKYEIIILGSKQYTEYDLKSNILKLSDYAASDMSFPEELLNQLQKHYLSQSYNDCKIRYEIINNKIIYSINEGIQTYLHKIKIIGAVAKTEKFYIDEFYNTASVAVQSGLLIKNDIDIAAKNLLILLKNQGFINAKLKKVDFSVSENNVNNGLVTITIEEGPQTKISEISIEGTLTVSKQEIIESLNLENINLLNLDELEAGLSKLQSYYANLGHLEMKIINLNQPDLVTYNDDFTKAQIKIKIFEGPKIYVGSILIDGNKKTHEKVIMTEIEFKVQDLLTPQKLIESTARLQKTGFFSSIEIKMLENNTDVSDRTVIISLQERKPGIRTIGAGITNENNYTLHGYAGIAYRNIGGWGRGVSVRREGSYNPNILNFIESKITFGYLEPYLFDTRARFRINYTTSQAVSDYTIRQKTITNQTVWSVEQDINSHLTGIWQIYNIANYVDEGISRDDEIKYNYSRKDLVIASTGPTLDIDYRDNILNPTSGNLSRLTLEYATSFLGSTNTDDFLRGTAQTTFYNNLFEQVVWANSLRGGYLYPLKTQPDGIRFDKKGFILGGRTTVRGFESNEFFPSTAVLGANYRLSGSSSYELFKSEFRFPILKKSDLSAALFYDGGRVNIMDLSSSINYQAEWRSSVGVALRYNLPIGPLNLEYAHKLNKKSYESEGAFHLSVGVF